MTKYDILKVYSILTTFPSIIVRTNREDALTSKGIEQVELACKRLIEYDINPSVVKYSLAAKSMDTADIVATQMQVRS